MKIYLYDNDGVFITEQDAREVLGDKIIPSNATEKPPLKPKTGYAVVLKNDKWEYVEDNRGSTVWSKNSKEISYVDYLGEIDSSYTLLAPSDFDVWEGDKWVEDSDKRRHILGSAMMQLADRKHADAERLILGYKYTLLQMERYTDKYNRAKFGEFDDDMNKLIINKYETMRSQIRKFTDLIEYCRQFVDDLIKVGEFDKAENAINACQSLGQDSTMEKIKSLLDSL